MDYGPGARALIGALVRAKQIEVRRAEIVARAIAERCAAAGGPIPPRDLEALLEDHPQVEELSATEAQLTALLDEHLPRPKPPVVTASNAVLEAAIRDARTDEARAAAVSVYADWLQEQGDPFGEQLALGLGDDATFDRWVRKHLEEVLGFRGRELSTLGFQWEHGFVAAIHETKRDDREPVFEPAQWERLFAMRSCAMVRQLYLGGHNFLEAHAAILRARPASLRYLVLNHVYAPELMRAPWDLLEVTDGTIEVRPATFSTEILHLRLRAWHLSTIRGEAIVLPKLRALHVWANARIADTIRTWKLPKLEQLTVEAYSDANRLVDEREAFAGLPGFAG